VIEHWGIAPAHGRVRHFHTDKVSTLGGMICSDKAIWGNLNTIEDMWSFLWIGNFDVIPFYVDMVDQT
jgi:hypothetical protein